MKAWSKPFATLLVLGAIVLGAFIATDVVRTAQYARAAQDVEQARQQLITAQDFSNVYKMVAKVMEPSVVRIDVQKSRQTNNRQDELLRRFFPDRDGDGQPDVPDGFWEAQGTGSGVIIETSGKTGYILTNNHVAGNASELTVTLFDGREIKNARLLGADPKTDLAVIKIEEEGLIPARWGNSDYLEKGDLIVTFGSPFGYVGSMTHGIVSALNRDRVGIIDSPYAYENFIQVDAPINPGNSGGPLVNLRGEVVGINTAIASKTGVFSGLGFAIPSNQAKFVYEQIKDRGKVVRGWLGVQIDNVAARIEEARRTGYEGNTGVLVKGVQKNAPAIGKLELDDVIVGLDGKKIDNMSELRNIVAATPPGTPLKVDVVRGKEKHQIVVELGEQPDDPDQLASIGGRDEPNTVSFDKLGIGLVRPTPQMLREAQITDATSGALVSEVDPGSPADQAGLTIGDLITKIDSTEITSPRDVNTALSDADLTQGIKIKVVNREGSRMLFLKTAKK
jgi:serine protease Do